MLNHLSPFSRGTGGFFCVWRLTVHRRLPWSALQCGKSSTVRTRRGTNLSLPCRAGFNQTQIWLRRDTGIRVTRRNCLVDCARFMSQRVTRASSSVVWSYKNGHDTIIRMMMMMFREDPNEPLPEQLRFNSCRHRLHRMRHHSKAGQYTPLVGQLALLGYMLPVGVGGLLHESLTGFWDV